MDQGPDGSAAFISTALRVSQLMNYLAVQEAGLTIADHTWVMITAVTRMSVAYTDDERAEQAIRIETGSSPQSHSAISS